MKYTIVQRTGFVPYFLSAWTNGMDSWDCHRARAKAFDGSTARRIASLINARRPSAPIPVEVETLR